MVATGGLLVIASGSATPSAPPGGGGQLAFHSELNGKDSEIYLVDLAKLGSPVNLTNNPAKDVSPAWSPNGTKLAFASDRSGTSQVYVMNAVSKTVTALAVNGPAGQTNPAWCTDTTIALAATGDIFVASTTDGSIKNITNSPTIESQPACTPDGTRVLFPSSASTSFRTIYDLPLSGAGAPRKLSADGWLALDPAVNPSGTKLLFFGQAPDGKRGLWENAYAPKATFTWNPKLVLGAKGQQEYRLTKYEPRIGFAWTPTFRSTFASRLFGTDLPQGSSASTGTRSMFFYDLETKLLQTLGYVPRFGEDANPVARALAFVYRKEDLVGLGGTLGADSLALRLKPKSITATLPSGSSFFDSNRSVVKGRSYVFTPTPRSIFVSTLGGNDSVTITGPSGTSLRIRVDCGPGIDELVRRLALPFFSQVSCEKVRLTK